MPAICHTITREEYSHCAFTGKVLRFAPMMRSRGFEVYHYGVETSQSGANVDIQIMTKTEWSALRIQSYKQLHPEMTEEAVIAKLEDPKSMVGELANCDLPIWTVFQSRLKEELKKHYRGPGTDIFCMPMNPYKAAVGLNLTIVESGIGYPNSSQNFRIFESYAWLHANLGKGNGNNYWFVVPNYFDSRDWPLSLTPKVDTVGFLGRIYDGKGCHEIVEMAQRFPTLRFVLCGQGDPSRYLKSPNVFYKPPIHGKERAEYLGSLLACVAPTLFIEPFCGVAVEAQLCGTPVITKDYGAQTETVENLRTGLRCHTLADYCYGIQMALDGKFDRAYIRERAVKLYDMFNVAREYEYAFKSILDVNNGKNGWYSKESHIGALIRSKPVLKVYYAYSNNIGDGANPLLFNSLLNIKVKYDHVGFGSERPVDNTQCVFGMGSILGQYPQNPNLDIICGSGFIQSDNIVGKPLEIISVRGELTRQKFLDAGINCPPIYGDLGLLFRYVVPKPLLVTKKYKIGLIPHYIDQNLDTVKRASTNEGWTIIDIKQASTPARFIDQLHECDIILSSSLHGIIIADSYSIPAFHTILSTDVIGNGFKFRDYYSSVNREYFTVPIDSFDTDKILGLCKPYMIRFDFAKYYLYIKESLKRITQGY
jgi:glycosyltransferase involved in cell wall biosynthesis